MRAQNTALDHYLESMASLPRLSDHEIREAGIRYQLERDPRALQRIVGANLRFVVHQAKRFDGMGLDLLDLISEGNLGLIEAAKRYDPSSASKFLSYACHWVQGSLRSALSDQGHKIRLPRPIRDGIVKLRQVEAALAARTGQQPTEDALAEAMGLPLAKVRALREHFHTFQTSSMDEPIGEDGGATVGDLLPEIATSAQEEAEAGDLQAKLQQCLQELPERERFILERLFGLGQQRMLLREIGVELGLCKERVRQIGEEALDRLLMEHGDVLRSLLPGSAA